MIEVVIRRFRYTASCEVYLVDRETGERELMADGVDLARAREIAGEGAREEVI